MNKEKIYEELTKIFADVFDDESIVVAPDMTADDVDDWDSLSHITLIAEIEEAFDIKFSMKEVIGMKNISEMVEIIERESL